MSENGKNEIGEKILEEIPARSYKAMGLFNDGPGTEEKLAAAFGGVDGFKQSGFYPEDDLGDAELLFDKNLFEKSSLARPEKGSEKLGHDDIGTAFGTSGNTLEY